MFFNLGASHDTLTASAITENGHVTPLMIAAHHNLTVVCDMLLKLGASVTRKDAEGRAALDFAMRNGSAGCAIAFLEDERLSAPVKVDAGLGLIGSSRFRVGHRITESELNKLAKIVASHVPQFGSRIRDQIFNDGGSNKNYALVLAALGSFGNP